MSHGGLLDLVGIWGCIVVIVLLALLIMMARLLVGLFDRLDIESRFRIADLSFEDPSSPVPIPAPSLFSEPTKALSIVIPAYNEEDRLPGTLEETMAYLQRRRDRQGAKFTYEVVVVDDGSTDRTVTKAQSFVRRYGFDAIRVLRLPANRGKGFAVKAGVLCCRGREVLFMDADGATGVSEVEKLEAKLQQIVRERTHAIAGAKPEGASEANHAYHDRNLHVGNGGTSSSRSSRFGSSWTSAAGYASAAKHQATKEKAMNGREHRDLPTAQLLDEPNVAFVLGSRAHLQESSMAKRTWVRNVLMHGFHFLVTMVVGNNIKDTQCGFKLMTRPAAKFLVPNQRLQRWAFDVELVYLAQKLNVPMAEVQVAWTEIPGSKVRLTSIAHIAFELAMIKLAYGTGLWQPIGPSEINKKGR